MKRKACKQCRKLHLSEPTCTDCGSTSFIPNWKGRVIILNQVESKVAHKMKLEHDGEYAIKVQ